VTTRNPYAPPEAEVADVAGPSAVEAAPALWNPGAAASWSLMFTPIFGAILQMKNWQALGEPDKAATAKAWAWGCVAFFVALTLLGAFLPDSKAMDGLSRLSAFALLITWYYANGKAQQAYVAARFGKTYPRKGWAKPLSLAVLGIMGFLLAAVVVGVVIGLLSTMF